MQNSHIAVGFMNGIGNFIFFTAAVKILKSRGYKKIDLITDKKFLQNPGLMELSEGIFNEIKLEYSEYLYDEFFIADWSIPIYFQDKKTTFINWTYQGFHEVWAYLKMINASWEDFDGYLFEADSKGPSLRSKKPRIALANCSIKNVVQKKRWEKFPELSEILTKLGYSVILLGLDDELDECKGINYLNKLSLRKTAKVLEQCDLLISSSTCLTVIADAVKTPVLLLEGPMTTSKNHPLFSEYAVMRKYISCAPCFQKSLADMCSDYRCMDMIEVSDVIQKMFSFASKLRLFK